MNRKLLIIGIDGGNWQVLGPAMAEGYMPYLQSLMETGARGVLESTMPAITPTAWASFLNGANPGSHGVFNFSYWDRKQKTQKYISSHTLQRPVYEILSQRGKRVGLINVPMTYPPHEVNGAMITGILTPSLNSDFTYPTELKELLLKAVPDYHIFNLNNIKKLFQQGSLEQFCEQLAAILENRVRAAELLLEKDRYDVFMVHFQATDLVQHTLWHYLDSNHPQYDPEKRNTIFKLFYKRLDAKIQELRELFTKNAQTEYLTLVVSDHGFESHKKRVNLGNWLVQQSYLKLNEKPIQHPRLKKMTRALRLGRLLKYILPQETLKEIESSLGLKKEDIDWDGSRAYSLGRNSEGFIYLLTENSTKRYNTIKEITEKLQAMQDPKDHRPVVANVYRKEEIYQGEFLERIPDLIIEGAPGYTFTGYYAPGGEIFEVVETNIDSHIGKHHKDGIFIAASNEVKQGEAQRGQIIDIVPTLLYYLQLPLEQQIDGRVLEEIFTTEFRKKNPLTKFIDPPGSHKTAPEDVFNQEDQQKITKRLEDLGYL